MKVVQMFAVLLLLCAVVPSWSATARASDQDDSRWCRACHPQDRFSDLGFGESVHHDLACRDCHQGFHFNPHEPVEKVSIDASSALAGTVSDPVALASCSDCHDNEEPGRFPHGFRPGRDPARLPICLDCHGDPHVIDAAEDTDKVERRHAMNGRCLACHADPERMEGAEVPTDVNRWYEHSMHARKLHLGSPETPGCADCHGGHAQRNMRTDAVVACRQCHADANESFASLGGHAAITPTGNRVGYYTMRFFAWLTFTTILILALHVLFDLLATVRRALHGERHEKTGKRPAWAPDGGETVQRFDVHQRLQHGVMVASFITLVLTGWPLSTHELGASVWLLSLFGGQEGAALVHRIAAVGLIVTAVYHLVYLAWLFKRDGRRVRLSMVPSPKDLKDVVHNLLYFFGLRKDRPRFPRYSYFEKFDYWAVFWGVAIMVGSGAIRWFPELATQFLPSWAYEIAFFAHADEALLAAMAIFVWHFYNVHLRPAVFPMSWVFIHGRLTMRELEEEHGAEYDQLLAARRAEFDGGPAEAEGPADDAVRDEAEGTEDAEVEGGVEGRAAVAVVDSVNPVRTSLEDDEDEASDGDAEDGPAAPRDGARGPGRFVQ